MSAKLDKVIHLHEIEIVADEEAPVVYDLKRMSASQARQSMQEERQRECEEGKAAEEDSKPNFLRDAEEYRGRSMFNPLSQEPNKLIVGNHRRIRNYIATEVDALAIPKSYADGQGVEMIDNSDMISH